MVFHSEIVEETIIQPQSLVLLFPHLEHGAKTNTTL